MASRIRLLEKNFPNCELGNKRGMRRARAVSETENEQLDVQPPVPLLETLRMDR